MIHVREPGVQTTVQDLGRPGHQRHGVAVGGALDRFIAATVNLSVGNDAGAALLEMALTGPDLVFEQDVLVAWGGADFAATANGQPLPRERAVRVAAGEVVRFGPARSGLRAWIAIAGGIDVPLVMGSRSTAPRAGIGGHRGRPLVAGDVLGSFAPPPSARRILDALRSEGRRAVAWSVRPDALGRPASPGVVRAVRGPEFDWFTAGAQRAFFSAEWTATRDADRMGVRLDGPELTMATPREMISSAVNAGVVQVPPAGRPIVLLPARQSVGGYPRLAAVVSADVGRLAQLRPGDTIRFEETSLANAHALYLAREHDLARVRIGLTWIAG